MVLVRVFSPSLGVVLLLSCDGQSQPSDGPNGMGSPPGAVDAESFECVDVVYPDSQTPTAHRHRWLVALRRIHTARRCFRAAPSPAQPKAAERPMLAWLAAFAGRTTTAAIAAPLSVIFATLNQSAKPIAIATLVEPAPVRGIYRNQLALLRSCHSTNAFLRNVAQTPIAPVTLAD